MIFQKHLVGPDCIPVVVLKNCEPELSYILALLFHKCLKKFCFVDCRKVSLVSLYLKMFVKGLQLRTTAVLVFFLWLVKSLKKSSSTHFCCIRFGLMALLPFVFCYFNTQLQGFRISAELPILGTRVQNHRWLHTTFILLGLIK